MSARAIRRSFAAPFVVTIATIVPAHADKAPAKPQPPKPEASKSERHWTVTKSGAKDAKSTDCFAHQQFKCPDGAKCNPPEPMPYSCPAGFDPKVAYKIVLRVGDTECYQERDTSCPDGERCNPPPPRKVTCPR